MKTHSKNNIKTAVLEISELVIHFPSALTVADLNTLKKKEILQQFSFSVLFRGYALYPITKCLLWNYG